MDPRILDEIAKQLAAAVPADPGQLKEDLRKNFRSVLARTLTRMSLVTREEFDVQREVLARTRSKLEALEQRLGEMERGL